MQEGLKRSATFCILKNGSNLLLLKRNKEPHKGKFVPVGGKIDPYESPRDAVIREVYEETGIKIDSPNFAGVLIESSPTNYNWISLVYVAEVDFIDVPACDEGELSWINIDKIDKYPCPKTDLLIYEYIFENKKFVWDVTYDAELRILQIKEELSGRELI